VFIRFIKSNGELSTQKLNI